jgi:hypothetical protein
MDGDPSAVLVVRVWLEGGTDQFRARLMTAGTSPGSGVGEDVTVTVGFSDPGRHLSGGLPATFGLVATRR